MHSESAANRSGIQVLARAADILRLLHGHPEGLSQPQIGLKVNLARSTVSRLLVALEAEGLVVSMGPRGRYRLGPELVRLASSARRNAWLDLHPLLVEFSYEIGETVDLSVLEGDRAVFVDQVVADNRLRAVSAVGDSFPLHASANGKAMLAAMPEPDLRRVLNGRLEEFTKNTLTTPTAVRAEIDRIKASDGIAFDREEQSYGVCAVGAVIGTVDHDLLALSVPVPKQRFTGREEEIRAAVLDFVNRSDEWIAARR
ncbi:MAG: IclR family transcriptional regulator [Actinomycetes bacterium]